MASNGQRQARRGASSKVAAEPSSSASTSKARKPASGNARKARPDGKAKVATGASGKTATQASVLPNLQAPYHNLAFLQSEYYDVTSSGKIKESQLENPKHLLNAYVSARTSGAGKFEAQEGYVGGRRESSVRVTVLADGTHNIVGYGDAKSKKEAEKLAAMHALLQLARYDLLGAKPPPKPKQTQQPGEGGKVAAAQAGPTAKLSDGTTVTAEMAREFMDFYCYQYGLGKPDIVLTADTKKTGKKNAESGWHADMLVGGGKIGIARASSKKAATAKVYLDAITYLEEQDSSPWKAFSSQYKPGMILAAGVPSVTLTMSDEVDDEIRKVFQTTRQSLLFANRPRPAGLLQAGDAAVEQPKKRKTDTRNRVGKVSDSHLTEKSERLMQDLGNYQVEPRLQKIRETRQSLPVHQKASDVLVKIELNQITIVMAATGSGKTTQIPQILFDDYIMQGQGAMCNIICTQPRRIAAISVAERVAKERGETVGQTVGYQVRFENKTPQPHGSITFCTTGVFLRRLQSALGDEDASNTFLSSLTHIILDEVHERDLETDLLLVVLKKLLAERKRLGKKEIKLVLMSATIDPKMFCEYFADEMTRSPAPVVEVSGRSFPVERHFLEETYHQLDGLRLGDRDGGWVFKEKNVYEYLERELSPGAGMIAAKRDHDEGTDFVDDLELPYPLISLMIAHVLAQSNDGHVLCFLPGWDEIKAVNTILEDTHQCPLLGLNFNDGSKFEIHILHSSIPVADQQAIFEPPAHGVRRIILSTNIAETSVTIPDVVYVIDSGRVKESRYDPARHLSSLVSAWVGTSNINQRAGRAGRHRPGEAYAVFSKTRYEQLNVSSTVEMKRVDLSNVVMHIKALDIPGMEVEEVLAAAIEPPAIDRVQAAMDKLIMVGALDAARELTSLGRVLLQLPIDSPMGKMCLYGAFFRCLDPALTLAAVLTNRDPWMAPLPLKDEAGAIKNSWSLSHFRSDPLVTLRAYTRWDDLTKRGHYREASRFCQDNFLGKITLTQIQQVKEHLVQSMGTAGIFDAILGEGGEGGAPGGVRRYRPAAMRKKYDSMNPELNVNSGSTPVLAALIALASVPNFAVRTKERVYRTSQDKSCQIHPSSVQHVKHTKLDEDYQGERDLFAFSEKIKNVSQAGSSGGPTMLRNVTRLDPLTYMLFGASRLRASFDGGMQCDAWLPITGKFDALDDVDRLKSVLDVCMLRVFEGISGGTERDEEGGSKRLAKQEAADFEQLTMGVVSVLNLFAKERIASQSRGSTRPATPMAGIGSAGNSGRNTPYGGRTDVGGVGLRI